MSDYSRWFSDGAYSFLNRLGAVMFGFMNVFFMVRIMPKDEIGIWVLFVSVTAILEMVRGGFIRNPFITSLVSAEEKDKKSIINASLALHCMLGLTVSTLLLVGGGPMAKFWDAPGLEKLFYLYSLNNLVFIPYLHFEYLQTAKLQFRATFICTMIRVGLLCLYILVHYLFNIRLYLMELAIVQLVATVIATVVAYPYVKELVFFDRVVNRKQLNELFHFGKFTFGTNISSMFIKSTDSWMIGRFISTAGVAVYNPAIRISNIIEVPTLAIANTIFPQVATKMKERGKEGVRSIYIKSVSLILALMLPAVVPLYLFSDFFIEVIFGKEYLEAAPILRVTIFYSLIIPFNRQFGTVMDGLKKPKLNFYLLVIVAILNVFFNFIFLSQFGLIGSAYATLLSYGVVFILNQIILYKVFGINTLKVVEGILDWYRMGWHFLSGKFVKATQ